MNKKINLVHFNAGWIKDGQPTGLGCLECDIDVVITSTSVNTLMKEAEIHSVQKHGTKKFKVAY